jgi:hypothetical protein
MAIDHPKKQLFLAACQHHLSTVGSNNWNKVLEAFPDVQVSSAWRWIRQAKEADVPRPELINARAKLIQKVKKLPKDDRTIEARANKTEHIAKHIPAAPSPAYIARTGEAGLQTLDFVAEIHKLYSDASMLRTFSMVIGKDEAGNETEKIKNPAMFDKSIARRAGLLETAIKAVQEVWDLRQMQNFYELIIEEIGRESPEAQRRIMVRLAELNSRAGMTISMKM